MLDQRPGLFKNHCFTKNGYPGCLSLGVKTSSLGGKSLTYCILIIPEKCKISIFTLNPLPPQIPGFRVELESFLEFGKTF